MVCLYGQFFWFHFVLFIQITEIIKYTSTEHGLTTNLLVTLAERFAHSKKWKRRQTFALLCSELLKEQALPPEQFASEVLPHLNDLSWDPVANVRLVVARCLAKQVVTNGKFVENIVELILKQKNICK